MCSSDPLSEVLSRRSFARSAAVLAVAALAGCTTTTESTERAASANAVDVAEEVADDIAKGKNRAPPEPDTPQLVELDDSDGDITLRIVSKSVPLTEKDSAVSSSRQPDPDAEQERIVTATIGDEDDDDDEATAADGGVAVGLSNGRVPRIRVTNAMESATRFAMRAPDGRAVIERGLGPAETAAATLPNAMSGSYRYVAGAADGESVNDEPDADAPIKGVLRLRIDEAAGGR
ncbi:hypothetical protein ACNS7O_05750 [Haloferacaceae archaeon DSL9]